MAGHALRVGVLRERSELRAERRLVGVGDPLPSLPIFLSEFTIPTALDDEFNFHVDPKTAAQWITEALKAVLNAAFELTDHEVLRNRVLDQITPALSSLFYTKALVSPNSGY